jgi:phosphatidylglycerol---prolipoprotein diacylglyceryl transferase
MTPLIPFFEPVKFKIPMLDFHVHGFGIMVALGLFLGTNMAMDKAKRDGLDPDIINRVVTWMIAGIFIGGHLGYALFYEPQRIQEEGLIYLLKFWDGLSSFGGFFFTAFLCHVFFQKENKKVQKENRSRREAGKSRFIFPVKTLHYSDCIIYGFPMAFGLGRVGCFMAHDHPGLVSDFPLAVYGICQETWGNTAIACHDLGLYEALWALTLIPMIRFMDRSKGRFQGFYMAFVLMYYAPVRFGLDYLRTVDARYAGLTPGQYASIALFLMGLGIFLVMRKTQPVRKLTAAEGWLSDAQGGGDKENPISEEQEEAGAQPVESGGQE